MSDGETRTAVLIKQIHEKLEASGKKAEIETELARKLNECGWRDDIKQKCFEIIEQRGKDNITVDELVVLIAPAGRASVPDALKADMLGTMKDFVQSLDL